MKTIRLVQVLVLTTLLFSFKAYSQEALTISGTRFTYPLIEKWIAEYQKANPNEKIGILTAQTDGKKADISILAQPVVINNPDSLKAIVVSRFALLPVAGKTNPIFAKIKKRGLNRKEFLNLFFEKDLYDDEDGADVKKKKDEYVVYGRDSKVCSMVSFSKYFDREANQLKGKKISGDDRYLLASIKKDTVGISFNNLGYLFNTQTRSLQEGIRILPLDISKEQNEILQNGDLDQVISLLENNKIETIPVADVSFVFASKNKTEKVKKFLNWVLENGQKYNHDLGFLNLKKETLADQEQKLNLSYVAKDNK